METVYVVYGCNTHSGDQSYVNLGYFIGPIQNIREWFKNDKFFNKYHPSNGGQLDIYDVSKIARRV